MNKKTIKKMRMQLRECFINENYFKSYNFARSFLDTLETNSDIADKDDFYICYVYLSNCTRRLSMNELSLFYAQKAIEYAEKQNEFIIGYDLLATCYRGLGDIGLASETYDKGIKMCDSWIESYDKHYEEQINDIALSKADLIHNKGDMLLNIELILNSIEIYRSLLYKKGIDNREIYKSIELSYKNIKEIDSSYIHKQVTVPKMA